MSLSFERAIRYVEQELRTLREELVAGTSTRWVIVMDAMARHFDRRIENIMLIEMHRPRATRMKTAAEWESLNRRIPEYAAPVPVIKVGNECPGRVAFGDHWLSDGAGTFPMELVFDVGQTVGGSPELHKYFLGGVITTTDRAIRVAEKENIEVIFDRLDGVSGHSLGGVVVVDSSLDNTERCRCLLELLAQELLEVQHQGDLRSNCGPCLKSLEAECIAWVLHRVIGLGAGEPPTPVGLADSSLATLVDTFHRVQQVSCFILKGLHREFFDDMPV